MGVVRQMEMWRWMWGRLAFAGKGRGRGGRCRSFSKAYFCVTDVVALG